MTNEEKIRQMTTWDLAKFIFYVSNHETKISVCEKKCKGCTFSDSFCISEIGEWLISEE